MAWISSPRNLSLRAELYHQIGTMLSSGVPLMSALQRLHDAPPHNSFRPPLKAFLEGLKEGRLLSESLNINGGWMPEFDIALISAAEISGRLDAAFRALAQYYRDKADLTRTVIRELAYPLFLLHFAALMNPFPKFFVSGNFLVYLWNIFLVLGPFYGLFFAVLMIFRNRNHQSYAIAIESFFGRIPMLGKALQSLAIARLAMSLEALISAGVSIIQAWPMAARASGSPILMRRVDAWQPSLESGASTPADLLSQSKEFPQMFSNLYHGGEVTGTLDDALKRLNTFYYEEGRNKLKFLARWVPMIIYFLIVIKIAAHVLGFYSDYFKQLQQVM